MDTRNEMRRCRHAVAAVLLALLAACGGGGGGGGESTPAFSGNFFPLAVGDRWVYEDSDTGSASLTVRATGTRTVNGQSGIVVRTDDPTNGSSESLYVLSASAVRQVPVAGTDPLVAAIGPVDVLRYPLRTGDRWMQIDTTIETGMDFDGDGRLERATVRSEVEVLGLETVTTPVANFTGSLHQRTTLTVGVQLTSMPTTVTVVTVVDDWYAPDIGPVRTQMAMTSEGETQTQTLALHGYRVGTLRSDTVAPTLTAFTPADGGTLRPDGKPTLTFSEAMDTATVVTATTLHDPAGQIVGLGVQVQESSYTFTPVRALVTGRYTLRVGTEATDLYGNALAQAKTWSFDVDATGPYLVSATPADGATDVGLDTALVLRFSEPIDPAGLGTGSVSLSTLGVFVPVTATLDGATLTLRPDSPLTRGRRYDLRVWGALTDLAGNTLGSDFTLSFTADAGRFAAPVNLLAPGLVEAVAVGDVNGDGRTDVVFTTGYTFTPAQDFKLMARLQQADGSLAAAQVLDTRAEYVCPARSVVIGDLDSDGRNDVLVGAAGCGIQVFHQGNDGVLRAATFIDSDVSGRLRLADFNGDGRLDLAAGSGYGAMVRIWLQQPDGSLQVHANVAFDQGEGDLDVGDVNGDGRLDLVATSNGGDASRVIGIVPQNADGSFAPVQTRGVPSDGGVAGVAVGDIDGDGRADIVVGYGGNAGRLGVMRQQADGSLAPLVEMASLDSPKQIEVVDVNGDGRIDVVVGHSGWMAVGVYLQQPGGTLLAETLYPGPYGNNNPGAMGVGDVTGDGRPDVVVTEALLVQRAVDAFAQAVVPGQTPAAVLRGVLRGAPGSR